MAERGIALAHTTILRWVQRYVPDFEKCWNQHARPVGDSWRVDETYIKIKGEWCTSIAQWIKPVERSTFS
jgi:transposase-like protein